MQKRPLQQVGSGARRLLHFGARHKVPLLCSAFFILVANLLKAAGPVVLQQAVDYLAASVAKIALLRYTALFIGIACVQGVLMFGQEQLLMRTAGRVERDLRFALFDHLQKFPLEFFHSHSTGELMARFGNDLTVAVTGAAQALMFSLDSIFALIIILPLMAKTSANLAFLAFAPLLLVIASTVLIQKKLRARFELVQEHFANLSAHTHAVLSAPRTIRAFVQEQAQMNAFEQVSGQYVTQNLKRARLSGLLEPLLQFFIGLSAVAVLWYGGDLTAAGKLSIGMFLQFIFYLVYLAWPMYVLGWQITVFQRGMVCMGRVDSLLSLQPPIRDTSEAVDAPSIAASIEFRNVSFTYEGAPRQALRQVSFEIAPGQMVGLVGTVGSGKSTLINMIPRLLEPSSGEILMGGRRLPDIPLDLLRSSIGYIPQETFLFSDTIAANIAFGRENASQQQIERAAEAADIAVDIARLPIGYATVIGERGVTLSGGQRQRLSIARAILRSPEIVLLDDALSSVDSHTEENILLSLKKVLQGKTCLIASHRISTLRGADRILVLHEGLVAEQGTHQELLAAGGMYAEMHAQQLLEEELVSK